MDDWSFLTRLHPAVVHYPIAFLTYGLACDLFSAITKRSTAPFGQWTLALGVAACLPSMFSGWIAAAEVVDLSDEHASMLLMHNVGAYATFFGAIMYTGLRFGDLVGEWRSSRVLRLAVAIVLVITLVATGKTGGILARQVAEPPATSTHP